MLLILDGAELNSRWLQLHPCKNSLLKTDALSNIKLCLDQVAFLSFVLSNPHFTLFYNLKSIDLCK